MASSRYSDRNLALRLSLVAERRSRHLTQAQVAMHLGVPQSFISKVESGERALDLWELVDVLRALGADPIKFITTLMERPQG